MHTVTATPGQPAFVLGTQYQGSGPLEEYGQFRLLSLVRQTRQQLQQRDIARDRYWDRRDFRTGAVQTQVIRSEENTPRAQDLERALRTVMIATRDPSRHTRGSFDFELRSRIRGYDDGGLQKMADEGATAYIRDAAQTLIQRRAQAAVRVPSHQPVYKTQARRSLCGRLRNSVRRFFRPNMLAPA